MTQELSPLEKAKFVAAKQASELVQSGMKVGLGTGSTAEWLVQCLGEMVRDNGLKIKVVPTSQRTARLAQRVGLDVITLDQAKWLDLTIDGADEFDNDLNLIKGGGGALLHEKIVATASGRMVVVADASKKVDTLGAFALPVEVVPFGLAVTKELIRETIATLDVLDHGVALRMDGDTPYRTEEGNCIFDLSLKRIGNARQLSFVINQIPAVVENGLFIDICDTVIVGHGDGRVVTRDVTSNTESVVRFDVIDDENIFADMNS